MIYRGDFIFWVKSPLTNVLLILDALALAGELRFSGVDRKDLLLCCCPHSRIPHKLFKPKVAGIFPFAFPL